MSPDKDKVKNLIQEYLLDEKLLREKLKNPNIEFGFVFVYPPGPSSRPLTVFRPKNKDFLMFSIGTQIPKSQIEILNSLKDIRFQ